MYTRQRAAHKMRQDLDSWPDEGDYADVDRGESALADEGAERNRGASKAKTHNQVDNAEGNGVVYDDNAGD
jgi:hypothetical protein